jgi:hypothetical protein
VVEQLALQVGEQLHLPLHHRIGDLQLDGGVQERQLHTSLEVCN